MLFTKRGVFFSGAGAVLLGGARLVYEKYTKPLYTVADSIDRKTTAQLPVDSNLVRVRIWRSGYYNSPGDYVVSTVGYAMGKAPFNIKSSNIGHVSIETGHFYASYWPNNLTLFNKLNQQSGSMASVIDTDLQSEGRPPEHLIDLHSLDVNAMNKILEDFQKSGKYHLVGPNSVFNSDAAHSCSSLAYALLKAGGILNFAERPTPVLRYVVATPNNVANLVLDAKIAQDNSKARLRP